MSDEGSRRSNRIILLSCWLGWLITAAGRQVSDIVKNYMKDGLGLSNELEISLAIDLAFWIGYIITALLFGILSDKVGRKKIIWVSLLMFSIPTALMMVATPTTFIIIRFFQGFAVGGFFPVAVALLADLNKVENRSKAVGRFVSGGVFGAIVGWLISGIVWDNLSSWRLGFLVFVPPIIGIAVVNFFILEESPMIREARAKGEEPAPIIASLKAVLNNRFLIIALLFCGLDLFSLWLVDDWLPYYVQNIFGVSATESALFRAVSALAGIIGIILLGFYSDKFGRRKTLFFAVIGGLLSTVGILIVSVLELPFIYLYPLAAAVGFFALGEFAAIYVLVMENAPSNRHGMAMGLCICIGNAIALTGGPIAASLSMYTILGLHAFMVVPLIALAIRFPLSLIAKDPAFAMIGDKKE
jgi:MFS family permease